MRRKVFIAGIGAGNPDFVTVQAIDVSGHVRLFFIPNRGMEASELVYLRAEIIERYVRSRPLRGVPFKRPGENDDAATLKATTSPWCDDLKPPDGGLRLELLDASESGAFLVCCDLSICETVLRILQHLQSIGGFELDHEVISGDSGIQALATVHKVALCNIGRSILTATGRSIAGRFPNNADTIAFMLNATGDLNPTGNQLDIHWTVYAGMPNDVLVSGKLRDIIEDISHVRHDALKGNGWDVGSLLDKQAVRYRSWLG